MLLLMFLRPLRLPAFRDHVLSCDGEALAKLVDMDEAFDLLLKPLAKHLPSDQQAIILIDAIDEADPLDQQLESDSNKASSFVPMSNKAMRLIVNCLVKKLPRNVRFIFTTR